MGGWGGGKERIKAMKKISMKVGRIWEELEEGKERENNNIFSIIIIIIIIIVENY